MIRTLRALAVAGFLLGLAAAVVEFDRTATGPWSAAIPVAVLGVLVALTIGLLLRRETAILLRHPDLFVPLGLLLLALGLLEYSIARVPFFAVLDDPLYDLVLFGGIRIAAFTGALLLTIVAFVAYAAWVTPMLWQALREGRVEAGPSLREMPRRWPAVFGVELLGQGGLLLLSLPAFALGLWLDSAPLVAVPYLFAVVLAWNLVTAPLVPMVVAGAPTAVPDVVGALRVGLRGWRRWAGVVLVHLLLLGLVTIVHTSRKEEGTKIVDGREQHHRQTVSETSWSVHTVWTGGYEDRSKWESQLLDDAEVSRAALPGFFLTLLVAVLALGVKLRVMRRVLELEETT